MSDHAPSNASLITLRYGSSLQASLGAGNIEAPIASPGGHAEANLFPEYFRILLRSRWLIGACMVLGLAAALALSLTMRPEYEATSRMAVELGSSNPLAAERAGADGTQIATKLETQLRIVQSDAIAKNVIDDLSLPTNCAFSKATCGQPFMPFHALTPQARSKLLEAYDKGLHAELIPRTQIVEVKYRSADPALAARIANAVVNVAIYQNFRQRVDGVERASTWLNGQLQDAKKQAEDAQSRFVAYQKQVGVVGVDENHNVALNRVDELNRNLATVQAERVVKEARYRVAREGNPELIAAVVPESVIQTLRKQQAELRVQYAELTSKYGDNYPRVVQVRSQLSDIQGSIDQEVRNIRDRLREEYEASSQSERMLTAALETQKQEALRVDASAIQYALLQNDVRTSRDLYESLMKKLKDAGIDQGLRSGDLRLVDEAETPTKPVRPRVPLNLALGLMAGLMTGVAVSFLRAGCDHSVRTPEDVEAQSLLPALAIVPRLPAPRQKPNLPHLLADAGAMPITLEQPDSEAAEAYRALRTTLVSSHTPAPKVISFVSGSGKEGKSTSAVNTAIVLAQQGSRVLLVDADMRCPTVHLQLGLPLTNGLTECLTEGSMPSPRKTCEPSLFVLPAGARPQYISESLSSTRMKALLQEWRSQYDFIIIDTPPVLAFTDGVIMAGMSDATVLVVRSMTTNREALWYVKQRLERANAKICGVLLNDVKLEAFDSETFSDQSSYRRYQDSIAAA